MTEDDRKFKQELDSLIYSQQNENLYVVDEGFIRFPALTDKENIRYDGIDDKESKIKRISDIFEDAEFKSLFGEGVQSIKEDVKDWENLEIDVSDNVNARLNDINKNLGSNFDRKFYACQVGGVKRSDVLVVRDNAPKFNDGEPHNPITIDSDKKRSTKHGNYERALRYPKKDDEIFYIEVKKGYEDAQYLKFEFRLDFKGTTPDTSSMNIIQMYGIDDDGMKELNTKLMEAWKNNDKLNHAYSEYKKNIDTLVKDLLSIKTIRNKFGDMLSDVNSFPEGFKKLSQIFNFYVLEWEHEYLVMKSSYLYTKLNTPNDTEQLNRISNVVTNLNEKMHRLTGGDMSAIKNDTLSFFDKFKMLYCTLISTDANKKEAEKYNKTVFSIDNIGNEELWDIIIHYYRDLKDVRYIQIGHDIYKLNGSKPGPSKTTGDGNEVPLVSGDDPLNMKDAKSQEELSKIPFNITLSVVKKTKYSRKDGKTKEVYDSESAGQKLFLDIKLSHPETSSGKGFDNISKINKTCKFISKKNNVSKIHEDDELIEHVNSILNEEDGFELEEGIETSKTKSNKFELDVAENVRRFLKSQNPPYNTLKVEHYEGSDLKYWSDIRVKNTNNGKRFWIEAKEDKYACLGSTSWKYRDGGWTCTTLEDNDPILKFMKQSLEENAQKFIRFCKDYLGTEDITLPGDLTDELVDAWKNSGSIEDTDNNVLFITNKIPITNFGQIISSFYRNSKNEPAYYIQVGDDLYTVAEDTNVLNLRTKDGRPLKTVAEAYRLGRIQFRLKGYDRPQKHYWSIYTDVKILADKENLDDNYSCSFNTEEKWPVIQSQETMNDSESEMSNNEVKE